MRAGKIIAFITAAVFIIFGFLFILGAFSPEGSPSWIFVGIVGLVIGFVLIFVGTKLSPPQKAGDQVVNLQVDLPGDVSMDTIKCKSCGAPLNSNDIKMVAGAPVVECPNCGTTYQLTEEPKW
jgi:DNA-directed RNA polymerase subunit RPC12/RpoP